MKCGLSHKASLCSEDSLTRETQAMCRGVSKGGIGKAGKCPNWGPTLRGARQKMSDYTDSNWKFRANPISNLWTGDRSDAMVGTPRNEVPRHSLLAKTFAMSAVTKTFLFSIFPMCMHSMHFYSVYTFDDGWINWRLDCCFPRLGPLTVLEMPLVMCN